MTKGSNLIYNPLKSAINKLDALTAKISVRTAGEKNGLSCFLFHSIKEDNRMVPSLFPQENLTLALLDQFINSLLNLNYSFIKPEEIHKGLLLPGKKYCLLTFDDGYFSNTWCVDILKKYNVPAVFFITTNWILENEKMWGDIVFCERTKQGLANSTIENEIKWLIPQRISKIKDYITREFGIKSFVPNGDEDRPMTESELHHFSTNPLVFIGNHTHNHECLTSLAPAEIAKELHECQNILKKNIGYEPNIMAYPYGRLSKEVLGTTKDFQFKLGFTVVNKDYLINCVNRK